MFVAEKMRMVWISLGLALGITWAQAALAGSSPEKPKVLIVIDEKVAGVFGTTGYQVVGQAENTMTERFIAAGFQVVDSQMIRRNEPRERVLRLLEGDERAAAVVTLRYKAQIVITGTAISKNAGGKLYGTNMLSIQAVVQARALRSDDSRVISSRSAQAAQAHIDEVRGGVLAIQKASGIVAEGLIADIQEAWSRAARGPVREITVVMTGLVSYRHLMAVRSFLERGLKGVRAVHQRQFTQGTAELAVEFAGPSNNIADAMARHKFSDFRMEPTNVTPNRLDLRAVRTR